MNSVLAAIKTKAEQFRAAEKSDVGLGSVALLLGFFCLFLVIRPIEPSDDLLRHLISYLHGYDYRQMYLYSSFPSFNMYLGFDVLVGAIHHSIGPYSFIVVQVVGILLFSAAFLYLLRGVDSGLRLAILLVALISVLPRIVLGRPSSFESSLMLLGFAMGRDERVSVWAHGLLGACMVPLYYLFPIYLTPLILVRRVYAAVLVLGLLYWHLMTDGAYWSVTASVLSSGAGRVVEINELSGIAPVLLQSLYAVIPAIIYAKHEKRTALAALWFLLPNQVRYMESAIPLMLSMSRHIAFRPNTLVNCALFGVLLSVAVGLGARSYQDRSQALKGRFEPGDRVYATSMQAGFKAQYAAPHAKLAPGFEPEWLDHDLRSVYVATIKTGQFDCSILSKYQFDYIVETNFATSPVCLQFKDVAGVYRIWVPRGE